MTNFILFLFSFFSVPDRMSSSCVEKSRNKYGFAVQWKTFDFGDSVTFFQKTFQKGEIQVIEILIQLFGCLLPNFSERNRCTASKEEVALCQWTKFWIVLTWTIRGTISMNTCNASKQAGSYTPYYFYC